MAPDQVLTQGRGEPAEQAHPCPTGWQEAEQRLNRSFLILPTVLTPPQSWARGCPIPSCPKDSGHPSQTESKEQHRSSAADCAPLSAALPHQAGPQGHKMSCSLLAKVLGVGEQPSYHTLGRGDTLEAGMNSTGFPRISALPSHRPTVTQR